MPIHISNTAKCSPDQGVFDHSLASLVPDQFLHVRSPNADQVHVVSDPGQMSVPRQESAQVGWREIVKSGPLAPILALARCWWVGSSPPQGEIQP